MDEPLHHLRLFPTPPPTESEAVRLVRPSDITWGVPIFRAPSLPTPQQIGSEVPFTANFRPARRKSA